MNKFRRAQFAAALLAIGLIPGALFLISATEQPAVRVAPTDSVGPRTLETQTRDAVVRDYLAAWQGLSRALQDNNASLLDAQFTGTAREKLSDTIASQQKLGIRTLYRDRRHDVNLIFYSTEGLSIQLLDKVEYDVELLDHDKLQATQHVRAQYLAILTPTEVRWKVRIFQSTPE